MLDKFYRSIILCTLFSFAFANDSYATHAMGADLTYTCIGNNQYKIRLQFYRDCNGINAASSETVNISAPGCTNIALNLSLFSITEITPSCPGIIGTACNNGGGQFGIQRFVYEANVTLPTTCSNWNISWQLCCRNNAITTLTNPGSNEMYIRAVLNTGVTTCNNSPVFLNNPTPFACVNQPVFYNHGANDVDGDNLRFSLTSCYDNATTPVSYNSASGISSTRPLITSGAGISIDPNTGAISFTPTAIQIGVLCVLVEEYRNGIKIGEVVRDIQFSIVNCTNQMPVLTGINGTNDFDTTIQAGQQLCFNIFSSDPDQGQTLTLNYNQAIQNATFSAAGSPFPVGSFCWTPTVADSGFHSFTVQVTDNYCPIVGQNTYTYSIYVLAPTNPQPCNLNVTISNLTNLRCGNNDGSVVLVATGGIAPYTYTVINMTTGQIFTNTTGIFNNLTAGSYNVVVAAQNGCQQSCSNTSFVISGAVTNFSHTSTASSTPCPAPNTNSGIITLTPSGGTSPYLYSIGNGFSSTNIFSGLSSGTYQTVVLDANGCSSTRVVTLTTPVGLSATVTNITQPACNRVNGSFTITANGGTAPYSYLVNNVAYPTSTVSNLGSGTYNVIVRDAAGCSFNTLVTLDANAALTLTTSTVAATCKGTCNGRATVTASLPATFVWSNGRRTSTISNLCAGVYTVTATTRDGCFKTSTVTITEPSQLFGTLVSITNETCAGRDASITLSASGGTAPYTFNLTNLANNTTQTNTNGLFSGLSAGNYSYIVRDRNNCSTASVRTRIRKICRNALTSQTGLRESNLILQPNPASTTVQIVFESEVDEMVNVTIVDLNGKQMFESNEQDNQGIIELNVSSWIPATYLVYLRSTDGEIIETSKLVIVK